MEEERERGEREGEGEKGGRRERGERGGRRERGEGGGREGREEGERGGRRGRRRVELAVTKCFARASYAVVCHLPGDVAFLSIPVLHLQVLELGGHEAT